MNGAKCCYLVSATEQSKDFGNTLVSGGESPLGRNSKCIKSGKVGIEFGVDQEDSSVQIVMDLQEQPGTDQL